MHVSLWGSRRFPKGFLLRGELDGFLEDLRQEGQAESSGQFALDIRKAVEKLAEFFPPLESSFLHYWVRFAVFFQAPELVLETAGDQVSLEFAAEGPGVEEVRTLFAQGGIGLRYLQMAVVGALRQGYSQVELRGPSFTAVFQPQQQNLVAQDGPARCQLRATRERQLGWLSRLRRWRRPMAAFPAQEFLFLETPVRGVPPRALEIPALMKLTQEPGLQVQAVPSQASGLRCFWTPEQRAPALFPQPHLPSPLSPARVVVVVHGANFVSQLDCTLFPAGSWVVIDAPEARLDLSLRQLIEPALAPGDLRAAQERLTGWLCDWVTERPRGLLQLSWETSDWLLDQLLSRGDRDRAWELLKDCLAHFSLNEEPLSAAILERAALLSRSFEPEGAAGLQKQAEQAWEYLQELSFQEVVHFDRWNRLHQSWKTIVDAGAVRLPSQPWLERSISALPLGLGLRCYRQIIRDGLGEKRLFPHFGRFLQERHSENLAYHFFQARLFLSQPVLQPELLLATCERLLARSSRGQGPPNEAPEGPLTTKEKRELSLLVGEVCEHALLQIAPDDRVEFKIDLKILLGTSLRLSDNHREAVAVFRALAMRPQRLSGLQLQRLQGEMCQVGLRHEAKEIWGAMEFEV